MLFPWAISPFFFNVIWVSSSSIIHSSAWANTLYNKTTPIRQQCRIIDKINPTAYLEKDWGCRDGTSGNVSQGRFLFHYPPACTLLFFDSPHNTTRFEKAIRHPCYKGLDEPYCRGSDSHCTGTRRSLAHSGYGQDLDWRGVGLGLCRDPLRYREYSTPSQIKNLPPS